MNLITEQHIIFDMEGSTQKEILHALAEIAFREGKVSDTDTFFQELCKREQECTTGFGCPSRLYKGSRNSVRQNET